MVVFLNGKFVPEEQALVSVFDRSFCLSDGLFEAMPIYGGKIFLWPEHFARLQAGAGFLKIKLPISPEAMRERAEELIAKNAADNGVLRIQLSRGVGPRGYSIKGANSPTLVMSLHPARVNSGPCKLIVSSLRIAANDPLTRFKSCNKLAHVCARMEADEQGADEALLLNTEGNIAEATSANLFWIQNGIVQTPPLESSALPGVTRGVVIDFCQKLKIPVREENITPELLPMVDGAFLSSIALEISEVSHLGQVPLQRSPVAQVLRESYLQYVASAR